MNNNHKLLEKLKEYEQEHSDPVSYTHLRAHETPEHLGCRVVL